MLNPQTEIKFSDYNSLYDILNPTVNGFRDFSLSFLIDYKAGASLFSGTNYSLYSEGLHKGTLLGCTVDNPGGSGFIGAGVMIDDNGLPESGRPTLTRASISPSKRCRKCLPWK